MPDSVRFAIAHCAARYVCYWIGAAGWCKPRAAGFTGAKSEETMHDLIIIGGGAAGMSAALFALGKGLDTVTIYEEVGGKAGTQQQLAGQSGEEYLAGAEAVQLFERRVTSHAGAVLRDRVIELRKQRGVFHIETQHHGALQARAVLIATGATPLKLDV